MPGLPLEDQININDNNESYTGIEAYLSAGRELYLRSDFNGSIETYIRLMSRVLNNKLILPKETIVREPYNLDKIATFNLFYAHIIKGLLHMILWLKYREKDSESYLSQFRSSESYSSDSIIIVCGKSKEFREEKDKIYKEFLREALIDFQGTVISGGTASGVPGLVGTISVSKMKEKKKMFTTIGYLPEGGEADSNYDRIVTTKSNEFSFLEVISYWIDILFSNVQPNNVIVLGFNGGIISSLEYKTALALGAKVCLAGNMGGAAKDVFSDPDWNNMPNLFNIPDDPLAIRDTLSHTSPGTK